MWILGGTMGHIYLFQFLILFIYIIIYLISEYCETENDKALKRKFIKSQGLKYYLFLVLFLVVYFYVVKIFYYTVPIIFSSVVIGIVFLFTTIKVVKLGYSRKYLMCNLLMGLTMSINLILVNINYFAIRSNM